MKELIERIEWIDVIDNHSGTLIIKHIGAAEKDDRSQFFQH